MELQVRGGVCESTVTVLFPGESEQTVNGGAAMPIFSDSTSLSTAFFLQEHPRQPRLQGYQRNGPTERCGERTGRESDLGNRRPVSELENQLSMGITATTQSNPAPLRIAYLSESERTDDGWGWVKVAGSEIPNLIPNDECHS